MNPQTQLLDPHDPSDKRPKLERARSAAEKENQPLQRTNSTLRRQYSQQETSTQRRPSDSGLDDNYLQRSHLPHSQQQQIPANNNNIGPQSYNQSPHYNRGGQGYYQGGVNYQPDEDPGYYQVIVVH